MASPRSRDIVMQRVPSVVAPNAVDSLMNNRSTLDGFWYLSIYGERYRHVSQLDPERNLLLELSSGRAVGAGWKPPAYEIIGRGTWPDWMAFWVPLLSERAVSALREMIAPHCELLPWIREAGREYTLLNVQTQIPKDHWSCETSSMHGGEYAAADVISIHGVAIPHLFVLEGYRGKVFVSDTLAQKSIEQGLRGTAFVHPRVPGMHLPFIRSDFGRIGTGFIRLEDDPAAEGAHLTH